MSTSNSSLNDLIDQWCKQHFSSGCAGVTTDRMDELKDHLMCVAEAQVEQGMTESDAFEYAVQQFGEPAEVKNLLLADSSAFRRWLARVHCGRSQEPSGSSQKVVWMSLVIAGALLVSAWLMQDSRSYAFLSTTLIAVWVVIAARMGGTREAARAEWRWLKRKFGF